MSGRSAATARSAPGRRSADEIEAIHRFRLDRAVAWFFEAAAEAPERHCPICDYRGPFSPVRHKIGTWCPGCDSRPRHRLLRLWTMRELGDRPRRVLHFGAELFARAWFDRPGWRYRTADIDDRHDLTLDIEAMALDDASEDLILANHVLEHVDDRRALAEIARVLAPGGLAVLTVPIVEGWDETLEEASATDEATRRRLYGDPLHRRFYGRDLRDRVRAAGLSLGEYVAREPDVSTHALNRGERLFLAERP